MRFNLIKELVIVDLLQASRQANTNGKKDNIDRGSLAWRLLLQNGAFLLIYGMFFGAYIFDIALPDFPGFFTRSIAFMFIFVFLQIFQLIFNLFYDDANLSEYLSLPFSLGELFVSKALTIILNTFAFFILPLVLISMLGWQAGHNLLLVIPLALLITLLLIVIMILIPFVFIHLLHQSSFYIRHKKIFTIIIYIALFAGLFAAIYGSETIIITETGFADTVPIPLFIGFFEIFIPGSYLVGWLKMGGWLLFALALVFIAFRWIIPQLYSEEKQSVASPRKSKKKDGEFQLPSGSKWRVFTKYQLRQLQDTTFVIQMIFSKLYFPIILLGPALFGGGAAGTDLSFLSELPYLWGIYLLIGAVFAMLTTGEISVSGIIISFDKENYYYIQSLPLSFRQYMAFKFWFAFVIEWLIGALIITSIALLVKLPVLILIFTLMGYTIGTFIAVLYYFMRDYRLLNLNWNNFTELMQRGLNQFLRILISFVTIGVGAFVIISLAFWMLSQNDSTLAITISSLITIALIGLATGLHVYAKKNFWSQFPA